MAHVYGPVYGHGFLSWLQTNEGLVAVDTGWDVAWGEPYAGSGLEALVQASEQSGLPLTHILLTHDHPDHVANLSLLRERWPGARVGAHANSRVPDVTDRLADGETLTLGGESIQVLASPGHSIAGDELCYYLPVHRFLYCGDVAQPQGPSYSYSTGPSPLPFFYDGDAYQITLERLIALDIHYLRTGHGDFLGPEQAKQWLRVTLATVLRLQEGALTLVERNPTRSDSWLAESLYDQIAHERNLSLRAANQRKRQGSHPDSTDYERFDLPGLLWAVRQAREVV